MSKILLVVTLLLASFVPNWHSLKHLGQYQLHFLDIGQGDAVLIRTPQNCTVFIDGGPGNKLTDDLSSYLPATERKIDLLVLTHPHVDHMGGLIHLINRYEIKNIFTTGVKYPSSFYNEFNRQASHYNLNVIFPASGQEYELCGLLIQVIYPVKPLLNHELENVNNGSVVLRIKIKDTWVYLPGDAEAEAEEEILDLGLDLKSDIMKAGHHGSRTSNTEELLEAVNPDHIVIQSGEGNQYQHPHFETIQNANSRNIKIHRNDKQGTVSFYF